MPFSRIICITLGLLLTTPGLSFAQKSYKWMKKKCPAVAITDAGDIYSTYDINEGEKDAIQKNGKLKQEHMNEFLANFTEKKWTGAMTDFDQRIDNKDVIEKFKAFRIAEFDDKSLLIIPSDLNQGLPKNFSPTKDMFLIIGSKSISKR